MKTIDCATESKTRFKRRLTRETIRYVVTCLFLFFVNLYTSPHYWWVAWIAGGWGLNLLLSALFHYFDCDDEEK